MTTLKIMTWNVENLFRPEGGDFQAALQTYKDKLILLATVINTLAPDVVALQEVGGDGPLQDLQNALKGTFPHRAISDFPDNRGIRVAFLCKHEITEQQDIVEFPPGPALDIHELKVQNGVYVTPPVTRLGRGAVRIRIVKEDHTIDVITAHLKSKLLSFPREGDTGFSPKNEEERAQVAGIALMRRMAEAVTLRLQANTLLENNNATPLILLGDFNDVPEAQTSLILNGPPGSEIRTQGFPRPDKGDDVRLFNLAPLIPEERRYSRIHNGREELLDQIWVSGEFFPINEANRHIVPAEVVVDSHIGFAGDLPSIGNDPTVRAAEIAPDHAPVTAVLVL